ncbi:DUF883 family protein [Legionella israelensis]|uniref:DUF883 family protein n=1 Tax=Legionella israelensis TaxID=454 RepID=A0A0W0W394_9GAMM|nr:DUF883 family protein [Legionella israelensis]KTD26844.1 hypothetical protein Lisr_1055 [Legionella israelensis]QBR84250.1 DUF883 family protein [Legionella israelensis]QBS08513.1 DUF883 family protein [Legionella israelensis]SCX76870.1 protein of unknown function [Legionella israelensis DSM 19235]STX58162.1 Bacterial protein of uncharacterised function (DUF883) [Legionella israelensis]
MNRKATTQNPSTAEARADVKQAASDLMNESKKFAHELYEDGIDKVHEAQDAAKEYSDVLLNKVRKNPLASVLIAAGVGFLVSAILRKE